MDVSKVVLMSSCVRVIVFEVGKHGWKRKWCVLMLLRRSGPVMLTLPPSEELKGRTKDGRGSEAAE